MQTGFKKHLKDYKESKDAVFRSHYVKPYAERRAERLEREKLKQDLDILEPEVQFQDLGFEGKENPGLTIQIENAEQIKKDSKLPPIASPITAVERENYFGSEARMVFFDYYHNLSRQRLNFDINNNSNLESLSSPRVDVVIGQSPVSPRVEFATKKSPLFAEGDILDPKCKVELPPDVERFSYSAMRPHLNTVSQEEKKQLLDHLFSLSREKKSKSSLQLARPNSARTIFLKGCVEKGILPQPSLIIRKELTTMLNISSLGFGNKVAQVLAEALDVLPALEAISIADNNLSDEGLVPIVNKLSSCKSLTSVDISNNKVDGATAEALRKYLSSSNCLMRELIMQNANVDDYEASKFMAVIGIQNTLESIDLSHNLLGSHEFAVRKQSQTAGEAIGNLLRTPQCSLKSLKLAWNMIRFSSGIKLAESIRHNKSLTYLDLSFNKLDSEGAEILGDGLYEHPKLQTLRLAHNNILAKPACVILSAVKGCGSLTELDLSENPIGEEGARSLLALNLTHGNRIKVDIRNCTLKIKDPTCWFQMHHPRGSYDLDLSRPYERAVCIELLRSVARDKDLGFAQFKYISPDDLSGTGVDISLKLYEDNAVSRPGTSAASPFRRSSTAMSSLSIPSSPRSNVSPDIGMNHVGNSVTDPTIPVESTIDEVDVQERIQTVDASGESRPGSSLSFIRASNSIPPSPRMLNPARSVVSQNEGPSPNTTVIDDDETYFRETFREAANRIFQQYDQDQSGTLDKSEVAHILEQLGLEGSWALVDKLVAIYDSDGSGCIEENEFVSFLMDVKKSYNKENKVIFANRYFYVGNDVNPKPKRYLPPSQGKVKLVVDGQRDTDDFGNGIISTTQIESLLDAGKTICESSALFEFALDASTWTINEARTFFKVMVRELGSVLQVMLKLLPRMATPLDVRMLIAYVTNHDYQQIQHLKLLLGPLFRILIGIPNGFYQLSLHEPNDRKALHSLLQLSRKHNHHRRKLRLGDTSQMGDWSCFRNVMLDGSPFMLSEEWLDDETIPEKARLEFDFVSMESVSIKETEISNLRLFRVLQALGMVEPSKRKRIFQRLNQLNDEGRQVSKGSGNRKWEVGHNAASNIAEHLESFFDKESLSKRVAIPYILSTTLEETTVLEEKKKSKSSGGLKQPRSKLGPRQNQTKLPQVSSATSVRPSSGSVDTPSITNNASSFQLPDLSQDVAGSRSRPGSSAMVGNELRTIDIYGQHIKDMLEHPTPGTDQTFIAMRIIDALEMILAGRFITCAQLSLLVERLPAGNVSLHALATYRVELIISLFSRIKDLINFDFVLKDLESVEIAMLMFRIGWLNIWNPIKAEGDICLNLARIDERQIAKMLVCLNFLERGTNWLHPSYHETRELHLAYRATHPIKPLVDDKEMARKGKDTKDSAGVIESDGILHNETTDSEDDESWTMPSSWLVESTFPTCGILSLQYFSGKGIQMSGAAPNIPIRMALMPLVLPTPYDEDLRHPSEFTVEHSENMLQKLGVKLSLQNGSSTNT